MSGLEFVCWALSLYIGYGVCMSGLEFYVGFGVLCRVWSLMSGLEFYVWFGVYVGFGVLCRVYDTINVRWRLSYEMRDKQIHMAGHIN